jgi:hypothetical protein
MVGIAKNDSPCFAVMKAVRQGFGRTVYTSILPQHVSRLGIWRLGAWRRFWQASKCHRARLVPSSPHAGLLRCAPPRRRLRRLATREGRISGMQELWTNLVSPHSLIKFFLKIRIGAPKAPDDFAGPFDVFDLAQNGPVRRRARNERTQIAGLVGKLCD